MQKLLGSMTSLLRRDVAAPLMTSFPSVGVTCPPLSMFARRMPAPCGPLARAGLVPPAAAAGPLVRGGPPMVRPVVWPPAAVVAGRRAPLTASASAPLLGGSRARGKGGAAGDARAGAQAAPVSRLELLTVAALRDECRRRRLPTGGPKPNLVRRLQQSDVDAAALSGAAPTYLMTATSTATVPAGTAPRPPVPAPPPVSVSSTAGPKSSLPVATSTPSEEARASLSQSQAIVARILSIRAAQRQRSAELAAAAAACSSTSSPPLSSSSLSSSVAAGGLTSTCSTSTVVASSAAAPVTVASTSRTPTSEVLAAAIARSMCAAAVTLPQFNVPRPAALAAQLTNRINAVGHVTTDSQQVPGQRPGQKGQGHGERCMRQTEPVGRQQEQLCQGRPVQGQNVGQIWDAESQETLCRQQQMLIFELRRQLEQSRRALIEAQATSAGGGDQLQVQVPCVAGEPGLDLAAASPVKPPSSLPIIDARKRLLLYRFGFNLVYLTTSVQL